MYLSTLGLNYYKARWYLPKLGRFLQTDPIFYADDMNMYAYVGNDPLNRNDPLGLWELALGLSTELYAVGGGKLDFAFTFDSNSLEIGVKSSWALGVGWGGGVGLIAEINPGSDQSYENVRDGTASTSLSITGSGNLGAFGLKGEVPLREDGHNLISPGVKGAGSIAVDLQEAKFAADVSPQVKVGGNVSIEGTGRATTALIPNAIREANESAQRIKQEIRQVMKCSTGMGDDSYGGNH
jgi:RHS repeat-associated protein